MAHLLDTTIPSGHMIHVCHACNNEKCSNPKHLYWGTAKENRQDLIENGGKTIWNLMIEKYGLEEAKNIASKSKIGNQSGAGNKGKPKSEEHRKKISLNRKGGRPKKNTADVA